MEVEIRRQGILLKAKPDILQDEEWAVFYKKSDSDVWNRYGQATYNIVDAAKIWGELRHNEIH